MIRTIIEPAKKKVSLLLPDDLVGKKVEVIAFEVTGEEKQEEVDKEKRIKAIEKGLNKYRVDLTNFKFDREEANDYE